MLRTSSKRALRSFFGAASTQRGVLVYSKRAYVTDKADEVTFNGKTARQMKLEKQNLDKSVTPKGTETEAEKPWYLKESVNEDSDFAPSIEKFVMPELPDNSPESLEKIVSFMGNELALGNIVILDMFKLGPEDEVAVKSFAKYMVICTGKSGKHIMKSSLALHSFLKHEYNQVSQIEGLTHESAKKALKRLKRSARKSNGSGVNNLYGDAAATENSWVMLDSNVEGTYIHLLTKERREELNLEHLWSPKEEKYKYERKPKEDEYDDDHIFSGLRYYHTKTGLWNPRSAHELLRRFLSTSVSKSSVDSIIDSFKAIPHKDLVLAVTTNSGEVSLVLPTKNVLDHALLEVFKNAEDLVKSSYLTHDDIMKLYKVYEEILQIKGQKSVHPTFLRKLLSNQMEPLEYRDLTTLISTYLTLPELLPGMEHRHLVNDVSLLLDQFSAQGGKLSFSDSEGREVYVMLAGLVFHERNVPCEDRVHSYRTVAFLQLISNLLPQYYEKQASKEILNFKNEIMVKALSFFVEKDLLEEFWVLWKNDAFIWAPIQIDGKKKMFDSRPWSAFLDLCILSNNAKLIDPALKYIGLHFEQNEIVLEPEVRDKIQHLLKNRDPREERFQDVWALIAKK